MTIEGSQAMSEPEALTPEEERHERDDHGPTVSSPEGTFCGGCDYRWPCPSARLLATIDAERAARQTPDTSGLREALAKADALAEQDEYAKDDHGGCAALDAYRDLSRALRDALAATERPLDEGCDCEPEHVWPCATIPRCDEPGCERETSCGFPSPTGYRRTCGEHHRAARLT